MTEQIVDMMEAVMPSTTEALAEARAAASAAVRAALSSGVVVPAVYNAAAGMNVEGTAAKGEGSSPDWEFRTVDGQVVLAARIESAPSTDSVCTIRKPDGKRILTFACAPGDVAYAFGAESKGGTLKLAVHFRDADNNVVLGKECTLDDMSRGVAAPVGAVCMCFYSARIDADLLEASDMPYEASVGGWALVPASLDPTGVQRMYGMAADATAEPATEWTRGYWNANGAWDTATGASRAYRVEPGASYMALLAGFGQSNTSVVALDSASFTDGEPLAAIPDGTGFVRFTAPDTGFIGVTDNTNELPISGVVVCSTEPGPLADLLRQILPDADDWARNPGVLFGDGAVDTTGTTTRQGYWKNSGVFRSETGRALILELEPDTTYMALLAGFGQSNTSVVALDSASFTDGEPLATIPDGVGFVRFRTGATGIVGLCTNATVLKTEDTVVARADDPGWVAMAVDGLSQERTTELTVGAGGSYDYKDPVSCFRDAASITGHKTIRITSGEYDMYELMGGDGWASGLDPDTQSWDEVQPVLDDVDIIGEGDVTLTMSIPDTIPSDVRWLISPLNVRGDVHIENLTIKAVNCRYAIHDESGADHPGTRHEYVNVRCSVNTNQAVGCGYSRNSTIVIDSCRFETASDTVAAYSWHSKGGATLLMRDTILRSGNSAPLRLSEENSGVTDRAVITDCLLSTKGQNQIAIRGEWEYTPATGHTRITLINTKVTGIQNGYDTITQPVESIDTTQGTITTILQPS